jgi:peptidoglycan/LPS O-acetylase OafA/YrhL
MTWRDSLKSAFTTRQTLEERLQATRGIPSGFDYMRVILAFLIVFFHCFEVSYGKIDQAIIYASWARPPGAALLPMFFALSGFLVTGSLERAPNIFTFTVLRALRILPALTVEVTLSALILGPLLTTVTLAAYFSDPKFFIYFENIIGNIHYTLPGLFHDNPVKNIVNAQLWTLPYELCCYLILIAVAVCGIYQRPRLFLGFCCLIFLIVCIPILAFPELQFHTRPATVMGHTLVITSMVGGLLFKFRHNIPWNFGLFAISTVLTLIIMAYPAYDVLSFAPLAYMTIYLGLLNPSRNKIILSGDYSYGLFLYGYPLQQAFASLGPGLDTWYWNALLVIPMIILTAVGSWWLIERPALRLRYYLPGYQTARH